MRHTLRSISRTGARDNRIGLLLIALGALLLVVAVVGALIVNL
jgi:hypothetical protein